MYFIASLEASSCQLKSNSCLLYFIIIGFSNIFWGVKGIVSLRNSYIIWRILCLHMAYFFVIKWTAWFLLFFVLILLLVLWDLYNSLDSKNPIEEVRVCLFLFQWIFNGIHDCFEFFIALLFNWLVRKMNLYSTNLFLDLVVFALVFQVALLLLLALSIAIRIDAEESSGVCDFKPGLKPRPHSVSILEFGAVGDGKTLNTLAFQNAIFYLKSFTDKGGAQLYVPPGKWLTGSFSLTSHLTLFLEKGAVILGSQVPFHCLLSRICFPSFVLFDLFLVKR